MSGGDRRLAALLARGFCWPNVPFDGEEYCPFDRAGDVDRGVSWE